MLLQAGSAVANLRADRCPAAHLGRALSDVRVFGGHPSEQAELAPRRGGWDIGPLPSDYPRANHLLCQYGDDGPSLVVVLPHVARVCEFKVWPQVVCR